MNSELLNEHAAPAGKVIEDKMLTLYQEEYERLFNWRGLWNRLSNSKRFTLATQNERIEEKAARANRLIGNLITEWDAAHVAPSPASVALPEADPSCACGDVFNKDFKGTCPNYIASDYVPRSEVADRYAEGFAAGVKAVEGSLRAKAESFREQGNRWHQKAGAEGNCLLRKQDFSDRDTCFAKQAALIVVAAEIRSLRPNAQTVEQPEVE